MTIILVRENYVALRHLNQMVEECYPGSTIVAFSSAEKAIEMIKKNGKQIALCFTEVVMHGSSGFRIVEELRRRNRRAKTVLIAQDKDYALEALQVGVNDYLIEPLTIESIHHVQISCR